MSYLFPEKYILYLLGKHFRLTWWIEKYFFFYQQNHKTLSWLQEHKRNNPLAPTEGLWNDSKWTQVMKFLFFPWAVERIWIYLELNSQASWQITFENETKQSQQKTTIFFKKNIIYEIPVYFGVQNFKDLLIVSVNSVYLQATLRSAKFWKMQPCPSRVLNWADSFHRKICVV